MSSLTDKETSRLRLFMKRLEELLASPLVKTPKKPVGVLSGMVFGETPEVTVVFDAYDNETFRSFYTTFRQFSMPKEEAVYVKGVGQVVKDRKTSVTDRSLLIGRKSQNSVGTL